jgi:hypothetical protein
MEVFDATFEVEMNGKIQKQNIQAPRFVLEQQFVALVQQAYESRVPVRVKMGVVVSIWIQFEDRWVDRENSIEFTNKAWQDSH